MFHLSGYYRTLRQYLATPKGAHDSRDYARALLLMLLTMVVVCLILYFVGWVSL
ncbi:hypothetical protein SELR_23210 [Selenomonas ruminantium subsp. lactilytica TAM6421]|uniref:Uncharacterized protein n=1 Tax=Selenomonas ruminantium subsp. lactilytica (strain NBRC 103574 / TAM6421) TaxID=927704 RepID=I0GTE2_SELRL|nr:hypothetical protein [Selenomonas ruminantium]BAL84029.1 hypothetical protein SELR_23210 [Selenomonas ruminantium subsp. lactilytica TAM6421]